MTRIPTFPSSHYRGKGYRPVMWCGYVMWLTLRQYESTATWQGELHIRDATEAEIEHQDSMRERLLAEARDDAERFAAWFSEASGA